MFCKVSNNIFLKIQLVWKKALHFVYLVRMSKPSVSKHSIFDIHMKNSSFVDMVRTQLEGISLKKSKLGFGSHWSFLCLPFYYIFLLSRDKILVLYIIWTSTPTFSCQHGLWQPVKNTQKAMHNTIWHLLTVLKYRF